MDDDDPMIPGNARQDKTTSSSNEDVVKREE
jgi:hypothetical protein